MPPFKIFSRLRQASYLVIRFRALLALVTYFPAFATENISVRSSIQSDALNGSLQHYIISLVVPRVLSLTRGRKKIDTGNKFGYIFRTSTSVHPDPAKNYLKEKLRVVFGQRLISKI